MRGVVKEYLELGVPYELRLVMGDDAGSCRRVRLTGELWGGEDGGNS